MDTSSNKANTFPPPSTQLGHLYDPVYQRHYTQQYYEYYYQYLYGAPLPRPPPGCASSAGPDAHPSKTPGVTNRQMVASRRVMELNTDIARRNKMIKDRNQKHMDHQNQVHEFWIDKIPLARDYGDGVCPPCPFNDDERRYNANIRKARWARQTGATKKKHAKQEQQSQAPATKTKKKHAKQEQRRLSSINLKPDEVSSSEVKVVLPTTKHQKKRK